MKLLGEQGISQEFTMSLMATFPVRYADGSIIRVQIALIIIFLFVTV